MNGSWVGVVREVIVCKVGSVFVVNVLNLNIVMVKSRF